MTNLPIGYCVSPNNITATPGVFIYASGGGVPEPKFADINLRDDGTIAVGQNKVIGEPYTPEAHLAFVIEREFSNAEEFIDYYTKQGDLSLPGVPSGFCNAWD